ncbi:MAG: arylsulfatase [Candidatus Brocadiaceae bacterium]|jgi:arylsulfatase A-like enzyme
MESAGHSPAAGHPNIVWIMADDMGYGDPACYNPDSKIPTPNMDRLAAEGVRFTDAHSVSAVCTPSRYGVITGRYCWRTDLERGVLGGFGLPLIEPNRTTVADLLRSRGYATACVGKWHLGLGWTLKDGDTGPWSQWANDDKLGNGFNVDFTVPIGGGPSELGFDYFFGIAGSLDMQPYCFIENDRTVGIPSLPKEPCNAQQRAGPMVPGWDDALVDTTFAEKATSWLERQAAERPEQPFFLYLVTSAPHRPCVPPAWARGASRAGPRGDMVALFDWVVGQVMDALERAGVADDTLLFVTSDNGAQPADVDGNTYGHKSCGDWRGFKADIWEGGHREPFIVRWPGHIAPGTTCEETVGLCDLMATCGAMLGSDLPEGAGPDSHNMLPALLAEEREGPIREALVHHSWAGYFSLRRGPWKIIYGLGSGGFSEPRSREPRPEDPSGQLYHMGEDPGETNNLWKAKPEVVAELTEILNHYREEGRSTP